MLTGWPQEDLLDALGGTQLAGGALFDRLEDVLPGPSKQVQVSTATIAGGKWFDDCVGYDLQLGRPSGGSSNNGTLGTSPSLLPV